MNSLNLRVSSVKSVEHVKKNVELRTSKLGVPQKYLDANNEEVFVSLFLTAKSVCDQVVVVKKIYKNSYGDEKCLQFLSDMYFYAPLKHPVRNQIAKLLQSFQSSLQSNACSMLNASIVWSLKDTHQKLSCHELNKLMTSLSGCFDNFPVALEALRQNIDPVFAFLKKALYKFKCETSLKSSPSNKNEIYLFIHNLIRLLLACIQEFITSLSQATINVINDVSVSLHDLILDDEMPMDVKTNCGNFMAYTAKINNNYMNHIENVAARDVDAENNCLILCHCIGVINTINAKIFLAKSEVVKRIIEKVYTIAVRYSTEPSMLLGATRILFQASKLFLSFEIWDSDLSAVKSVQKYLIQFVLSYLEHHMDSVCHICKDLLRNIIKLNAKLKFHDMTNELFEICNHSDTSLSLKCTILIGLSNTIGTEIILKKNPNLVDELITNGLGYDLCVNNCFESLMNASYSELNFVDWKNVWIVPLIKLGGNKREVLEQVEILINKAIKNNPRIVEYLIDNSNKDIALSTRLSALWTIRKSGLKQENFQSHLNQLAAVLKDVMTSKDDDTKIMALRLVVETQKTTEVLTDVECDVLLEYLKYNSNCQSPAIRQRSLALILKGLLRLNVSFERALKQNTERVVYYRQFLKTLMKMLVSNLFVGANFSRRSVSIALLEQAVLILQNCSQNINECMPENMIVKLIDALNDSYESNKAKAVSVLKCAINSDSENVSLERIKELMISVRPTDSLTCAYTLEFFCFRAVSSDFGNLNLQNIKYSVNLAAILWCMNILEDGLELAQKSILRAARKNPLYGCIVTIKHLLSKLDLQDLKMESVWRHTFAKLIQLCKISTRVVAPIVNSSSPEGHLPNDFSELPENLGEMDGEHTHCQNYKVLSNKRNDSVDILKTTPQMVLLCAWRTVKEVSLLLGEVVLLSPIKPEFDDSAGYLIKADQILEIGDHFKELLSETKHRGAFEQAYVGFSKVCTRLWRTSHSKLYKLPMQWLNDLIELVSCDERINEKICATRRSAGIPFMVQALITSELQVGTSKALTCCMKVLLELCLDGKKNTESRTHALNILRALFRCSDLNEVVGEYIADGMICAIRGYSAYTWAERNSSTLLFSALITRIFGVQRTKDWGNLTIRNRMTGRIFFLRYPKLYDFFLEELKECSVSIQKNERPAKLHPLLLLISRLYPSSLEGTESTLKVSSFVDYISTCSASAEMSTRILTAKAIVAFMSLDSIESRIFHVLDIIKKHVTTGKTNHNYIHGLLLQILYMLRCHKSLELCYIDRVLDDLLKLCTILKSTPVTWKVYLDTLLEIFNRPSLELPAKEMFLRHTIGKSNIVYSSKFSQLYPVFRKSYFVYNLYAMKIVSLQELSSFFEICFKTTSALTYEEIESCLNIVLLIMLNADKNIALEHDCNGTEMDFVNSLGIDHLVCLKGRFKSSANLGYFLKEITAGYRFYPECTIKAYTIMSELSSSDIILIELINLSKKYPDDVKNSIALCVKSYIQFNTLTENELKICLDFLETLSLPWNDDNLRLTAAKIVHYIARDFFIKSHSWSCEALTKLVNIMLTLSRDDDSEVRHDICQTVVLVTGIEKENICASYLPIVFVGYLCKILKQSYNTEFIKNVMQTILSAHNDDAFASRQNEDGKGCEVFDKNEANVFAEPYKTLTDCIESFSECFNDNKALSVYIDTLREKYCICR